MSTKNLDIITCEAHLASAIQLIKSQGIDVITVKYVHGDDGCEMTKGLRECGEEGAFYVRATRADDLPGRMIAAIKAG